MCTECMVGMYSAYRNVLYNELGWKPSFFSVLKMYYFGFYFVSYIIILGWCLWQCLGLHYLPLFKYEYLMSVDFTVCKGKKIVKQYFYSLQKLLRFSLQSLFFRKVYL